MAMHLGNRSTPQHSQSSATHSLAGNNRQFQLETVNNNSYYTSVDQPATSKQHFTQLESASQYYASYGVQCFCPQGMLSDTSSVSLIHLGKNS